MSIRTDYVLLFAVGPQLPVEFSIASREANLDGRERLNGGIVVRDGKAVLLV